MLKRSRFEKYLFTFWKMILRTAHISVRKESYEKALKIWIPSDIETL